MRQQVRQVPGAGAGRPGSVSQNTPSFDRFMSILTLRTRGSPQLLLVAVPRSQDKLSGEKIAIFPGKPSPALLSAAALLLAEGPSFVARHLHAGAQLPRDAASSTRGGCTRFLTAASILFMFLWLLRWKNNKPSLVRSSAAAHR